MTQEYENFQSATSAAFAVMLKRAGGSVTVSQEELLAIVEGGGEFRAFLNNDLENTVTISWVDAKEEKNDEE